MGLVTWLCAIIAERLNRTRVGWMITTGVAVLMIAWAIVVAVLITSLLIFAALGYYP